MPGAILIIPTPGVANADVCVSGGRRASVSGAPTSPTLSPLTFRRRSTTLQCRTTRHRRRTSAGVSATTAAGLTPPGAIEPPPHVTEANGLQYGMALGAQRFYAFGSSFVPGYKWMSDYVIGERDILAQISDGLAAAVIMTECAVALYEAQSTHPLRSAVRERNYPHWLDSTISAWRPRFQECTSAFTEPIEL